MAVAVAPADCAFCLSLEGPRRREPLFEDHLWHVRHSDPPYGVAGWMMLVSRRHVAGPAHFNDREAENFGLALRHFEKVLEEVTGALRVYTAAMGESCPHFHAHMVPRYPSMPLGARGWAVFDLERASRQDEVRVDPDDVKRVSDAYRAALVAFPLPGA